MVMMRRSPSPREAIERSRYACSPASGLDSERPRPVLAASRYGAGKLA
jgi:hypothetical protein